VQNIYAKFRNTVPHLKQRLQSKPNSSLVFTPSVDQLKCVNWFPVSMYVNMRDM